MFQSASGDAGHDGEALHRRVTELEAEIERLRGASVWADLAAIKTAAEHHCERAVDEVALTSSRVLNEELRCTNAALAASRAALAESEDRYRAIVESATNYAIITLDLAGRITGWNAGAQRVLGWTETEVLWRDAAMIFTLEDREAGAPEAERRLALVRGSAVDERWHVRRDGTRFWAQGQLTRLRSGGLRGYLKILRDRTEQRLAEEALCRSETRLRVLSETIPQLVWTSLANAECDWVGPQWQAYTGLSTAESLGRGWSEVVHPDDRARLQAAWHEAMAEGRCGRLNVEHRLRRHDGAWRWFQARAVPVPAEGGEQADRENGTGLRWFGTSTDIEDIVQAREVLARGRDELEALVVERTAELMAAEATLRQAQKMEAVGQLTGGIAHDFNNMLQGIGSSLEMLQRRFEQGRTAEAGRYVASAREGVDRAAALTRRLLAFARRQALQPRAVEPDALIEGMAELIERTVGSAIRVGLRMGDGTWPVLCDPHQLESALLNLAINARDAMPDGGTLTIGTAQVTLGPADVAGQEGATPGDYVEIAVRDTGTGMTPEVMACAFEPFFTTKPVGQGTGLGLSQLYGFTRQSNGVVRLDSAPGQGTTVRLYLPRCERVREEPAQPMARAEPKGIAAGEAVLLVEDEREVREIIAERLCELGYTVLEATDGPAGLRAVQSGVHVDLLVTDVGLPGMNGRQLAEAVRERWPSLPVLLITGYAGHALEGQLAPGVEVIGKPFTLGALAARVRAMLEATAAG